MRRVHHHPAPQELSSPRNSPPSLNPTKQNTNPPKKVRQTLHAINPQKRTIEVVLRRADTMQENIRKTVALAGKAGCPTLARISSLPGKGGRPQKPAPSLPAAPSAAPAQTAPPSQKRHKKCRKSAQIHTGNHLPTQTPSTTYEEFYAKTPPPPLFRENPAIWHPPAFVELRNSRLTRETISAAIALLQQTGNRA